MRTETVKTTCILRGAVLNYESGILCHGGFKNCVCVWGGGGLREWPLTENGNLSELPTRGFYENDDLFELHKSKKWSL